MLLQCWHCVMISAIVTVFPDGLLGANSVSLPKAVTPRLAIVSKLKEPAGEITCSWVVTKPVYENRSREVNGKVQTYKTHKDIPCPESKTFSLHKAAFQDAQGNRLSRETFESRIKLGDTIVVSRDGKPVDQAYLRIVRDDVLVLVPTPQEAIEAERVRYSPPPPTPPSSTPPLPAPSPVPLPAP